MTTTRTSVLDPPQGARSRRGRILCGLACLALGAGWLAPSAPAQQPATPGKEVAAIIKLSGEIDGLTERTLETRVKAAVEMKARFVVLSIESPGGDYYASRTIAWNLSNLEGVRTIAFIRGPALSGATIVAFGCDEIFMRNGAQLGDVMPIYLRKKLAEMQIEVAEKMISPVRKDLQQLAEKRGYPLDVAAAMVDPSVELHRVEVKDPKTKRIRPRWLTKEALENLPPDILDAVVTKEIVCPEGKLFVVGPEQAQAMGMARLQPGDIKDLCKRLEEEYSIAEVVPVEVGGMWWEGVVRFITSTPVKLLLFVIGVIAVLVALSSPGLGVPEGVAALCFVAVFFGSYLIGLADWIEPLLFLAGLALLAVEVFVTPGFGVLGALGAIAIAASLLLSFQNFVVPGNPIEWETFTENLVKTGLGCSLAVIGLAVAIRFLPKAGPLKGLVLEHVQDAAPEEAPVVSAAPVGATGETVTSLRPIGKVKVGDLVHDARAEDGMLDRGVTVVVVAHSGVELVVASRPEATTLPAPESEPAEPAEGVS